MENIKQKLILFVFSISHATTQNWIWKKCLNIMTVPCNCCLLLELSVSSLLAHTFWTPAEFTARFLSLSVKQTQHIPHRLLPAFVTIVGKLTVSKRHPLFSRNRRMSITLRYQTFLLNTVSPFPFPHSAGADILDDFISINKALYFIMSVFSIPCCFGC